MLTPVSIDGQDILLGASSDGDAILTLHGYPSNGGAWLYDGALVTQSHAGVDVSAQLSGIVLQERRLSLAPDGVTVIGNANDGFGFTIQRRASRATTTFAAPDSSELANVNLWVAAMAQDVSAPRLSPDELSFFFYAQAAAPTLTGLYEVTRSSRGTPFGRPNGPLGGSAAAGYVAISGVSADRLTVFATGPVFETHVLVRAALGDDFAPRASSFRFPAWPTLPPVPQCSLVASGLPCLPAWQVMPLDADCTRLIGVGTIAGAPYEEVFLLNAEPAL